VSITLSAGLAECRSEVPGPEALLDAADAALYAAKASGRGTLQQHTPNQKGLLPA
jgi:PleD family two-component response regulator